MGILNFLNGWKTILGYVLMSIPGLTDYPMIKAALESVLAAPTRQNAINAIIQIILVLGVADRVRKNLQKLIKSDKVIDA